MQIFLSYASEHHSVAKEVALAIRELGHSVFFDKADLPPAQSYHSRVRKAVGQCDRFIFLISPASIAEGRYTRTELRYAEERWPHPGDRVLPVVIQAVEIADIPEYLRAVSLQEPSGNIPAEIQAIVARWPRGHSWKRRLFFGVAGALIILAGLTGPKLIDTLTGSATQDRFVSGQITDPNGEPARNAAITILGMDIGTNTDASGRFEAVVPDTVRADSVDLEIEHSGATLIARVAVGTDVRLQMPDFDSPEPPLDRKEVPLRRLLFGQIVVISYASDESLAKELKDILDRQGAHAQMRRATSSHPRYAGGIVYQSDQERLAVAVKVALADYVTLALHLTDAVQLNSPLVIYLQ